MLFFQLNFTQARLGTGGTAVGLSAWPGWPQSRGEIWLLFCSVFYSIMYKEEYLVVLDNFTHYVTINCFYVNGEADSGRFGRASDRI